MDMRTIRCPICGAMNYIVNPDEWDGWIECEVCKASTCSMEEFKKRMVKVPLLAFGQLREWFETVGQCL